MSTDENPVPPYRGMAEAYDVLYDVMGKDYKAEAQFVSNAIVTRLPRALRLIDVACGTGRHLEHLSTQFETVGLDASKDMLALARRRLPAVPLFQADMRTFHVRGSFDAVTCLFSSIGNVHPVSEMRRAIANMVRHLAPGGVLVVEPWFAPDHPGLWTLKADAGTSPTLAVARTARAWTESDASKLCVDMRWLIARSNTTEFINEYHEMGLYARDEYLSAARDAGCKVEWEESGLTGRGLMIGVRAF